MERPFLADAGTATFYAVVLVEAVLIATVWWESRAGGPAVLSQWGGFLEALLWVVPVGFVGACAGTALAAGMGWKPRWRTGLLVGAIAGLVAVAMAGGYF